MDTTLAAKRAVNALQVQSSVIEILLVHIMARLANEDERPTDWLRGFADEVHASVDRAPTPSDPQAQQMAEALRDRLDALMHGVHVRVVKR